MRLVSMESLASNDLICIPRFNELQQPGVPGAFDLYQIVTIELGDTAIGFELRISATNIITNELVPLRIPGGGFVISPDQGEIMRALGPPGQ